jgi:hypothetical protein
VSRSRPPNPPGEGERPLFARRGVYSDEEVWDRVQRDRDALLASFTAAGVGLPRNFTALASANALAALRAALPGRYRVLIREVFDTNGPFGDPGTVRVYRLTEPVAVPQAAPLAELIDTELNADGPYALVAEGQPLRGECLLIDAVMDERRAVYRFTFLDIEDRREVDPDTRQVVTRQVRVPTEVDATIDFDRALVAIHGGGSDHARRLRTLFGQALGTPANIVALAEYPALTDPMMHALIDVFDGRVPGGRVEPLNEVAAPFSYGTRDQSESRRNASNLRSRREGKHSAVRGVVMLSRLNGRGLDRPVQFTVNSDWSLAFKVEVEPLVYFRLLDELRSAAEWREWQRALSELAAEGLRASVGAAVTDAEVQDRVDLYRKGVEDSFGPSLGNGLSEFRRSVVVVDVINALWRVGTNAARLPAGDPLQLSAGLRALFDDLAAVRGTTLTRDQRIRVVRAVLSALGGDRPTFFARCIRLARL